MSAGNSIDLEKGLLGGPEKTATAEKKTNKPYVIAGVSLACAVILVGVVVLCGANEAVVSTSVHDHEEVKNHPSSVRDSSSARGGTAHEQSDWSCGLCAMFSDRFSVISAKFDTFSEKFEDREARVLQSRDGMMHRVCWRNIATWLKNLYAGCGGYNEQLFQPKHLPYEVEPQNENCIIF